MLYNGDIFKNKILNIKKLIEYGFIQKDNLFFYSTNMIDNSFSLNVEISKDSKINTKVIELSSNEEYELLYVQGASGEFIGKMKLEYENILFDISQKCFNYNVFKSEYAKKIINYVKTKYDAEPEYLWEKLPDNAVFREKKSSKWFAVILTVQKKNLGINKNEKVEIIDIKASPQTIERLVDNEKYFPGYHMNKKHWLTICLDGSVNIEEIFNLIDTAYSFFKKN